MFSPEQMIGNIGEKWAFDKLVGMGYAPTPTDYLTQNCDFKIGNLPVEVKFANQTLQKRYYPSGEIVYRPRWQWLVHPTAKGMEGDWLLILIARDQKGVNWSYVLPGGCVLDRVHIQITSHPTTYSGWLSGWLEQWLVISYLMQQTYLDDGPTYHEWLRMTGKGGR